MLLEHRGVSVPPSDGWDSIQKHCSDADWAWLWSDGIDLGLFRNCVPYAGTEPALRQLDRLLDIAFVTSRPRAAARHTLRWLADHDFPVYELHVVCDRPKSEILPQADIYIDDAPHVVEDLHKNTYATVILFDRPWNQGVETNEAHGIVRLKTWSDVVAYVRSRVEG